MTTRIYVDILAADHGAHRLLVTSEEGESMVDKSITLPADADLMPPGARGVEFPRVPRVGDHLGEDRRALGLTDPAILSKAYKKGLTGRSGCCSIPLP